MSNEKYPQLVEYNFNGDNAHSGSQRNIFEKW